MSNGKEFDRRIEKGIDSLQAQIASATAVYDRSIAQESRIRGEVTAAYRAIAQAQARALDLGDMPAYDAILARAQVGLRERQTRRDSLVAKLPALEEASSAATKMRVFAQDAYDAHLVEMEQFWRACDARLSVSPAHQALVAAHQQAFELSESARHRAIAADDERQDKAGAYDADPIFSYLHDRGYGTAAYAPNAIVQMVDGWLARLCRYAEASVNYRALCELPRYLYREATRLEQQLQPAADAVARAINSERMSSGEQQKSIAGASLKVALDLAQSQSASARAQVAEVRRSISEIELWQDEHSRAILVVLEAAISDEQIDVLEERVQRTAGADDDAQLQRILRMRADIRAIQHVTEDQKRHINDLQARLAGLRSARDRYRGSNFHSGNYRVGGNSSDLLAGVIAGTIAHELFWSGVQSQTRYDPPAAPSSSSSSFGGSSSFSSGGGIGGGSSDFSSGGEF